MALLPRRIALAVVAVGSIVAGLVIPATPASASSVPAPTLVSPANTTSTPLKDVVLQWNGVPGASLYQVQISPNGEWTNNPVTMPNAGQTVNTLFEVPIGLPHGSYFWHVRAQVGGVWGSYSARWQFLRDWQVNTIAILKAPTSADPTVEWAPVPEASLYVVVYKDLSSGSQVSCDTEQTSFTPYGLLPSPTVDGTTLKPTPIPEDLGGTCFDETSLVDGDSYEWAILAYDDTSAAAVVADDFNGDPLACTTELPECGGYAGDTYISPTPFTFVAPPVGNFDTNSTATGLKTTWHTAASANGSACSTTSLCPVTPTFSWDPTPGANAYRVDVYLDPQHTNDYRTYTTAWPELTPRDFYLDAQAGAWYYWRVQPELCKIDCSGLPNGATCEAGTAGSNTLSVGFSVLTPGQVNTPLDIAGSGSYTVSLSESAGAPVCAIASSGQLIGNPSIVGNTISYTYVPPAEGSVTFTVLNQDGTDSQQSATVTVFEAGGLSKGQFSPSSTFGKQSGPVTLTSPVNGSTLHGGSVTFRWDSYLATGGGTALEARNYEVQVSQDPNFDTTIIDDKDVDLTQFTDPDNFLLNGSYYWRVLAIDESGHQLTWSPRGHFTVDATNPTVSFVTGDGIGITKSLQIQTSERITGIKTSTLKVVPKGDPVSDAVPGTIHMGVTAKLFTFIPAKPLGTGVTYVLVPKPSLVDGNGNPLVVSGAGVRTALTAKSTSKGWTYSHGWVKGAASSALSGYIYAAGAGRSASIEVGGSEVALFGCLGPDFGDITVSVGGHSQTVSEHQSFTQCGQEIWQRALPATQRKLTVSVVNGVGNIDEVQVDGGSAAAPPPTG